MRELNRRPTQILTSVSLELLMAYLLTTSDMLSRTRRALCGLPHTMACADMMAIASRHIAPPSEYKPSGTAVTYCFAIDNQQRIWVPFTGRGLFLFLPAKEQFEHIPISYPSKGRPINKFRSILFHDDHIWLGSEGIIFKIDPKTLQSQFYDILTFASRHAEIALPDVLDSHCSGARFISDPGRDRWCHNWN